MEILQGILRQSARELNLGCQWTFQHYNDPKHTSKLVAGWLQKNTVNVLEWQAQSPDLNPIENQSILEERVEDLDSNPRNITELEEVLKQAWKKIKLETLENLIFSMPDRIKDVIKNKGHYVT